MSTFRFNFSGDTQSDDIAEKIHDDKIQWLSCDEVVPDLMMLSKLDNEVVHAKMFTYGDVEIGHVAAEDVINNMPENDLKSAVNEAATQHSDLVAGKYEGGLKIWECTEDLVQHLEDNKEEIKLENKSVLDLGCGAGIVGIYTLTNRAKAVTFQDYNKEILEHVTVPNVLLNIEEEDRELELKKCKFYSGDWESFNNKIDASYDFILTSETIYNQMNYNKLIDIFVRRLSKDGCVYVAAKTYYFGVGGGTRQFEDAVDKNGLLTRTVCWKSSGGIKREIIKLTKK